MRILGAAFGRARFCQSDKRLQQKRWFNLDKTQKMPKNEKSLARMEKE